MGVFSSLSAGIGALKRNPVILALMFAYSLLAAGTSAVQIVDELLVYPAMLILYLLLPFFIGGVVGMIHDGLTGTSTLGRFLADGKAHYLSLFGGGLVLGLLTFALYFVVGIVGFIIAMFVLGFGGMAGATSASVAVLAVGGLIGLLIILLPWLFLQFFPAAVVVDDLGLVDSFKRSGGMVKSNFLSVVGFDALALLVSLVAQIPTAYLFYAVFQRAGGFPADQTIFDVLSTTELGIYLAMTIVIGTIVGSILYPYYVAYYDQIPR